MWLRLKRVNSTFYTYYAVSDPTVTGWSELGCSGTCVPLQDNSAGRLGMAGFDSSASDRVTANFDFFRCW